MTYEEAKTLSGNNQKLVGSFYKMSKERTDFSRSDVIHSVFYAPIGYHREVQNYLLLSNPDNDNAIAEIGSSNKGEKDLKYISQCSTEASHTLMVTNF